jgi:hypothetical protein
MKKICSSEIKNVGYGYSSAAECVLSIDKTLGLILGRGEKG